MNREVVGVANEQNLIPLNKRSKEDAKRIQKMGKAAQTAAQRRKKSLKEAADLYLSLPVANTKTWNAISKSGVDPEDIDNQMAIIVGLSMRAAKGDSKAAKVLFDILGNDEKESSGAAVNIILDV